ncbi:MAG: F0F1 ATP synthase subunit A [Oscillospiraceae bacterium]|nr:F0F1 ATP synthase subunit A [Oscillospiraceae bacterium]
MSVEGPRIVLKILIGDYTLYVTETIVNSFIVVALLSLLAVWLGSGLKKNPDSKKQAFAEMFVSFMNKLTDENLGAGCRIYAPYLAGLFLFIFIGAIIGLVGLRGIPSDISVTATLALMTACMIFYNSVKSNTFVGHFKGLASPPFMLALNILGEFTTPASMAIRLFGNVSSGSIITALIYAALTGASVAVYKLLGMAFDTYYFNIFQVGVPAVLSIYFDLFAGCVQAYVFINLTMAYIRNAGSD